jgi:predicted P-loop ATPase/GTPase
MVPGLLRVEVERTDFAKSKASLVLCTIDALHGHNPPPHFDHFAWSSSLALLILRDAPQIAETDTLRVLVVWSR